MYNRELYTSRKGRKSRSRNLFLRLVHSKIRYYMSLMQNVTLARWLIDQFHLKGQWARLLLAKGAKCSQGTVPALVQFPSGQSTTMVRHSQRSVLSDAQRHGAGRGGNRGGPHSSPGEGLSFAEDAWEFTSRMRKDGNFWQKGKHEQRAVKAHGYWETGWKLLVDRA